MAVSVIEPIFTVCEETALFLAQPTLHREYYFDVYAAVEFGESQGWTAMAFVFGVDGPLESSPYLFGHRCDHLRSVSNAEAATEMIVAVAGESAVANWHGYLVYNYGNPRAQEAAQRVTAALHDGCLATEQYDALMRADGIKILQDSHRVPEKLAESVFDLMPEFYGCAECDSSDPEAAMDQLGYAQCADCPEWIATGGKPGAVLCYDCAEYRGDCAGECMSVFVDGQRHGSHVITTDEADSACTGECRNESDESDESDDE